MSFHEIKSKNLNASEVIKSHISSCQESRRNAKITACVLVILSMLFLVATLTFWGVGTLPPPFFMGLGVFFTFAGHGMAVISVTLFLATLAFTIAAAVRKHQITKAQNELNQLGNLSI